MPSNYSVVGRMRPLTDRKLRSRLVESPGILVFQDEVVG